MASTVPQMGKASKPSFGILNNSYYQWTKGWLSWYNNPDNITTETYEKMYRTDETVNFGIEFIKLASIIQLGPYTHKDANIAKFVNENFELMKGNLFSAIGEIMSANWAGHSSTEIYWKPGDDNKWWIDGLFTVHPKTITYELFMDGPRKNDLKSVIQYRGLDKEARIDPEYKRVVYTRNMQFGNIYGNSMLKAAYKNWFIKDQMLQACAKAMMRHASPFPLVKASNLETQIEIDGKTMSYREYISSMLNQMYSGNSFIVDLDTEIEIVEPPANMSQDFLAFINYLNKMMFRALLMPSLIGDADRAGSYALGKKHFEVFLLSTNFLIKEVADVLIDQLIRWMITYNFNGVTNFGSFQIEEISESDVKIMAECFEKMTNVGYISPEEQEDFDKVRSKLGFPERKVSKNLLGMLPNDSLIKKAQEAVGTVKPQDIKIPATPVKPAASTTKKPVTKEKVAVKK